MGTESVAKGKVLRRMVSLVERRSKGETVRVGIEGFDAAGKTTRVDELMHRLLRSTIVIRNAGNVVLLIALLAACSPEEGGDPVDRWRREATSGYIMTYSVPCGPADLRTAGTVEVSVSPAGDAEYIGGQNPSRKPRRMLTVDEIHSLIERASQDADVVLADYGPNGEPRIVEIDSDVGVAGDEVCIHIWDIVLA